MTMATNRHQPADRRAWRPGVWITDTGNAVLFTESALRQSESRQAYYATQHTMTFIATLLALADKTRAQQKKGL